MLVQRVVLDSSLDEQDRTPRNEALRRPLLGLDRDADAIVAQEQIARGAGEPSGNIDTLPRLVEDSVDVFGREVRSFHKPEEHRVLHPLLEQRVPILHCSSFDQCRTGPV